MTCVRQTLGISRLRGVSAWGGILALLGLATPRVAVGQLTIGRNVRVSAANGDRPHFELLTAADPAHPGRMLACTMAFRATKNAYSTIVYTSIDGGVTWTPSLESTRSEFVGDPACTYGLGDTAYVATLPIFRDGTSELALYRSVDGGTSWEVPTILPLYDREYLAVDGTGGPYRGRLYLYASGRRRDSLNKSVGPALQLLRSTDGGRTFKGPATAPEAERYSLILPGEGVLRPDGALVIPALAKRDSSYRIEAAISEDGGAMLTAPAPVAEVALCGPGGGVGLPSSAIDSTGGPFSGRLYVVWQTLEGARCQIRLAHSDDGGRHWSAATPVNDDRSRRAPATGPTDFLPAIAVNKAGVVAISWYDRREHPNDVDYSLQFTVSLDGGVSVLPSVRVSAGATKHTRREPYFLFAQTWGGGNRTAALRGGPIHTIVGPHHIGFVDPGHTHSLMVDAMGVFHAFWYDNRTGVLQLWTAPIVVASHATRQGAPELQRLADVTDSVAIDYLSTDYSPRTRTVALALALANTSHTPITAPLKMRLQSLTSPAGTPRVVNAANGMSGVGAIWDISEALSGGVLPPGAATRSITLRFRILDFEPVHIATKEGSPILFTMDTRVFSAVGISR